MNRNLSKVLKYILSVALMALMLFLAFRGVDWANFADGLRSTDFIWVAASMACGLSAFFLRALRWRQLLRPLDPGISFTRTMDAVCIGNLANCVLPFSGEIARCGVVSTRDSSFDKTLGTIALERVWDLVSIVFIVILALVLKGGTVLAFLSENVWNPLVQEFAVKWWAFALAGAVLVAIIWLIVRFRKENRILGKVFNLLSGIGKGFVSFARMDHKWTFLLYTVLIWTMYWLMTVCISRGFPAAGGLEIADTLFIMAVGNLASVIPVPGGFGAYHYIVAMALSSIYGLSWDSGMVFATLSHESQALVMISTGIICYVHYALAKKKN